MATPSSRVFAMFARRASCFMFVLCSTCIRRKCDRLKFPACIRSSDHQISTPSGGYKFRFHLDSPALRSLFLHCSIMVGVGISYLSLLGINDDRGRRQSEESFASRTKQKKHCQLQVIFRLFTQCQFLVLDDFFRHFEFYVREAVI